MPEPTDNPRDDGYRGIWWWDSPSDDEYRYVYYSGGFATYTAKHIPLACYSQESNKTFFCYGGTRKDRNQILAIRNLKETIGMVLVMQVIAIQRRLNAMTMETG